MIRNMLNDKKVAILGLGIMGRTLSRGLCNAASAPSTLIGSVRRPERVEALTSELGHGVTTDNCAAAKASDVLILCTKPAKIAPLLNELREGGALDHDPLIVSIAAGLRIGELEALAGHKRRVVRAMPNTPCRINEGMTVLCAGAHATDVDMDLVHALFAPLGRVLSLDEEHIDTVTGLAASGPAFIFVFIEALAEGGVLMGLPRKIATELAAQTMQGAARMVLETGEHPAALKDQVTTPAGCTISALLHLEDGRIRSVIARGVQEAARAAANLGGPASLGRRE